MDQPISLETVVGFLLATPLFGGLDAAERGEVVRIMDVRRLQAGEEIFHEGDAGDAWYVIFEGQANVLKDAIGGPTPISTLGVGACFGEMAILDGLARSATVRAAGPLTIFRFRRERFEELLNQGSLGAYKLVAAMARTLSKRQRRLTQQISELLDDTATSQAIRDQIEDVVERYQVSE